MSIRGDEVLARLIADLGDPAVALSAAAVYLRVLPERTALIKTCGDGGDVEVLTRVAHMLASGSATLGLHELAEWASRLEREPTNAGVLMMVLSVIPRAERALRRAMASAA